MKKVLIMAFILGITAMAAVSGCINISDPMSRPSPTPYVIYGPVTPSPIPVTDPHATPAPSVIVANAQPSNAVTLIFSALDTKVFNWDRTIDGQTENITVIVANDDSKEVKNVVVVVSMSDNVRGVNILYQDFPVGSLAKGERKLVYLITDSHEDINFAKVKFKVIWGENGEYYNDIEQVHYLTAYV